jgi:ABC-type multidrug transport system permease subunit
MPSILRRHVLPLTAPMHFLQSALIYSPTVYFFALLTAEIPWLVIASLTGPVVSYFLIGLSADVAVFSIHFLILILLSFIFVLIAKTASHTLPSFELAQVSCISCGCM